ncbi:hypothetical protein [Roseomonas xinghualingensis]|uniref:hypothetical protein n=1 Tax=Roseomonas xinghualingensis TaxID=2986475 RepID=UPI0021F0B94B|nr:hypothetical protein [Roseomonas sp. SXEYE001]MCV4209221.1 hypothetical protein [Roseomonas sp. SXEYE001]
MRREDEPQRDGYEAVGWARDDGIGTLTLHYPERRNVLNAHMHPEIANVTAGMREEGAA